MILAADSTVQLCGTIGPTTTTTATTSSTNPVQSPTSGHDHHHPHDHQHHHHNNHHHNPFSHLNETTKLLLKTSSELHHQRSQPKSPLIPTTSATTPTTPRDKGNLTRISINAACMALEYQQQQVSATLPSVFAMPTMVSVVSSAKPERELDIEFDGTTVLCRVCGDKASGFHYGVHSCEGCKGFFRRSIQQKIQYRPCTKNQQCSILRINRNRCQYCRLKKCMAVGMSRDAVRFGRVPKREKARILAAMQQSSYSRSQEKALAAELEDEQRLRDTVVRAHLETCEFTRDKFAPILARAREQPNYTACPPTLTCPLNPNPEPLTGQQELLQDFSKRFSPAIRGVVEFAKRIPGFGLLAQDDQVTLLKAGVFEVLLVRLACMFDAKTNSIVCLNNQVLKRESIHNSNNARFLMDSMFDFAERVNSLRLLDSELGLFCSVVVIDADRPGLRNTELVERMNAKLRNALQSVLAQNHPQNPEIMHELMEKIPDLRTLNTLHSEKLIAFKMTEQQQQLQAQQAAVAAAVAAQQRQQQQQQQQHSWPMEEEQIASWSLSSDVTMDEAVKSPLGSVSSTDSTYSGEVASLMNDYHQHHHHHHHHQQQQQLNHNLSHHSHLQQQQHAPGHHASSAPLLAATLAGGLCPHRRRANSGGTSSGDDELHRASLAKTAVPQAQQSPRSRKLDSPSDSGVESGTEKLDKTASSSSTSSAPTSVCSSPRFEDKEVEDMPVLKRVLQAPPLYDTNSLMDEAYKPHKKFRALRQKDSAEAEPAVSVSPQLQQQQQQQQQHNNNHHHHPSTPNHLNHHHHHHPHTQSQLHMHLTSPPARSPSSICSQQSSSSTTSSSASLSSSSSSSALSPSLSSTPSVSSQQHQQQSQPQSQTQMQSQTSLSSSSSSSSSSTTAATTTPLVTTLTLEPALQSQFPQTASLLSSTHSTLAKSLMESPRMTAEQLKRTDIIHHYIMRGDASLSSPRSSPASHTSSPSPATSEQHYNQHHHQQQCPTTSTTTSRSSPVQSHHLQQHHYHHHQQQQQQQQQGLLQCAAQSSYAQQQQQHRWPTTSVITTTTGARQSDYLLVGGQPSPATSPKYLSAAATSSTTSMSPRPASSGSAHNHVQTTSSSSSPNMVELQVDIADSQQPLNLSKKSPSPSPRPSSLVQQGPATCKVLSLEA